MCAAGRDAARRIGARIPEGLPRQFPVASLAELLVAGSLPVVQRPAYERGDDAQVLGDDPCAGAGEHFQYFLPLLDLLRLFRRDERRLPILLAHVSAKEADQMIHAVAVVQLGAASRAVREPLVAFGRDHIPPICGEAPVLSGL